LLQTPGGQNRRGFALREAVQVEVEGAFVMAQTQPYASPRLSVQVADTLRLERTAFGAKVRSARAILGLSQDELAEVVGLTQRSIHRIEQGQVEPRLRTILTIEQFWSDRDIAFEDMPDGGFRLVVKGSLLRGQ
jgi:DNA-binding XRE family transcriptional regulator